MQDFLDAALDFLNRIDTFIWGPLFLIPLLLGTGLILSIRLKFMPIRRIPAGLRLAFQGRAATSEPGEITPFQALSTALAATVGTGNIAGVATAIAAGGPGAVFWMWMTALLGMATKYSEAVLAVTHRQTDAEGRYVGGPMYYISRGLSVGGPLLGGLFAFFAMIAAFGLGNMVQANSVADAMEANFHVEPLWTGIAMAVITFMVIIGGLKRIARVAEFLVPFMAVGYVIAALIILAVNITDVPQAFMFIVKDAFSPTAAAGGFLGASVWAAMQFGVARGIFSNEAGLGSAAIAHAAARTNDPVRQGTIAMMGTFIDTIVVCTMTALVIITVQGKFLPAQEPIGDGKKVQIELFLNGEKVERLTDAQIASLCQDDGRFEVRRIANEEDKTKAPVSACVDGRPIYDIVPSAWATGKNGAELSTFAFGEGLPGSQWVVTIGLVIFAITTVFGWAYYGERAAEYLLGVRIILPYRLFWVAALLVGAVVKLDLVFAFSDVMNGLMAIPNLIALLALSGAIVAATKLALAKGK